MRVKTKGAWGFLESPAFGSAGGAALTGDECVIGSAPGSDILVNDPTVSRRHAVLRKIAGRCEVADLGSTNGTFVNGRKVTGASALADHDVVRLGDVKLTFVRSSSGSRFNGKRLAYIALSLVAIGGIGFAATSYFAEKPDVASEESPKPPVGAAAIASPLPTVFVPAGSGESAAAASPVPATDPCKELSVDFDAALRGRLASGLSADEAHIYACGDLTRQACLVAGIAALYSSAPTNPLEAIGRTPEETRLLNEKAEKLMERVSLCQKNHGCDVVDCSELH
jgi:hypothetical protein